ncbi:MAG: class I SAM-dependent methyltransferase [Solirubrobacterales bacterium]
MPRQPGRAEAYERHTGRYAAALASEFVPFAGVEPGMRVLDVGCGTGKLTEVVASMTGSDRVVGVDPSEEYLEACRTRLPGTELHTATGEELPFEDGAFDCVLSQMVVQALDEPPRAAREMVRVCAPGGTVATCAWDFRDGMPLLDAYWGAALAVDPEGAGEAGGDEHNPWCTFEGLQRFWREAGAGEVEGAEVSVSADYDGIEDAWWPFAAGAGLSGSYCRSLNDATRTALHGEFQRRLGSPPGRFSLTARAWMSRGRAPLNG